MAEHLVDRSAERMQGESPFEEVGYAQHTSLLLFRFRSHSSQDHHGRQGVDRANLCEDRESIQMGQVEVENRHLRSFLPEAFDARASVFCQHDLMPLALEHGLEQLTDTRVIINHENSGHGVSLHSISRVLSFWFPYIPYRP